MRLRAVLATGALAVVAACTDATTSEMRRSEPAAPAPAPSTAPTTTAAPPMTAAPPVFDGAVTPIDDTTRARMSASWRPGCPVPLEELRLLTLDHWGYDGAEHPGELVVHADHAQAVLGVFATLFEARYPIERVRLVDEYGGDDAASTRANNTAGFNCRSVVGRPGAWSEHAFGRAIDLNPLVNPYALDPNLADPALAQYLDRSLDVPGMVRPGDRAVEAFAAIGWAWGGTWSDGPDYQHFSATGR
ncbi:MAG TPA: M15 family metallopeptidase [Acidimicrobiia bacterium]